MKPLSPLGFILLGFALLVLGFLLVFAMVIPLLKPTFFLSFLGYGISLVGMLCGMTGVALYGQRRQD